MNDLQVPLRFDVVKRRRRDHGKAEKENVCFRVAESAESGVLLLTGSIPQSEVDELSVNFHTGGKIVKNSGDVVHGEAVFGV